ncbi:MAG: ribonuclease P protein component 1 [Euryarchaeota archaeon]|nr:ribonuclease P protein component 1 [Euryarchaeota archaeon]
MRLRAKYLTRHELIGLECSVVSATDRGIAGISGKVVDETKNMLVIETERGRKMVPKKGTKFVFRVGERLLEVDGESILARPEDRIKG